MQLGDIGEGLIQREVPACKGGGIYNSKFQTAINPFPMLCATTNRDRELFRPSLDDEAWRGETALCTHHRTLRE